MQSTFADQEFAINNTSTPAADQLALLFVLAALATPGIAGEYERHGHHQRHDSERHQQQEYSRSDYADNDRDENRFSHERFFNDDHRHIVREYYSEEFLGGRCPPGLARKHNGCQPPGQAKRWVLGRPLLRNVVYYDLPPRVIQRFAPPPPGYRLVRVASDVLLIAIGTGMVMDALGDLNGM